MNSLWAKTETIEARPALDGDRNTDVLIIGAGMAGVLCAYFLKKAGVDGLVVEAEKIGMGITKNTTAKITCQHGLIYSDLIRKSSVEKAWQYLYANELALEKFREICQGVDCDFEEKPAYIYSTTDRDVIEDEVAALEKLGYPAAFAADIPLPFKIAGAIRFDHQAQFHPLKFMAAIAKELPICENTRVKKVSGNTAYTDRGNIHAKKIIIASHFPFIDSHGFYFVKMYQQRSYVLALKGAKDVGGMYLDERENGLSFRNHGDLLLLGGGGHRTGKQGGGYDELRYFARKYYPAAKEQYAWATQDCMTLDGAPYIGQYAKSTPDLYVATGFNKWGMTSSMAAAMILSDRILEKRNPYAAVFLPQRSILKPQLLINAGEAVIHLLTPTLRRCTHLGCALKWNKAEKTWDCPCHGSRFQESGEVIDNPANRDRPRT